MRPFLPEHIARAGHPPAQAARLGFSVELPGLRTGWVHVGWAAANDPARNVKEEIARKLNLLATDGEDELIESLTSSGGLGLEV